ncbi:MAG: sugar transferase [Pseudomonadota bacterium]
MSTEPSQQLDEERRSPPRTPDKNGTGETSGGPFDLKSSYLKRLTFFLDIIVVSLAYWFSIDIYDWLREGEKLNYSQNIALMPIAIVVFGISRYMLSRRLDIRRRTMSAQTLAIIFEVTLTVSAIVVLSFLLKLENVSRLVIVTFAVTSVVALLAIRRFVVWWNLSRSGVGAANKVKVLIVGSGKRARRLAAELDESAEWGVDIVGFLDPKGESAGRRAGDEIIGHVDQISQVLRDNVVEDVIIAVPRKMLVDIEAIVNACEEEGVRLRFLADFYDFKAARIRLSMVNGVPLLSFEPVARDESALFLKRIVDVSLILLALPILIPVFALVALAIKIDDPGPVFFTQQRIGYHKRKFPMFKFRSMVVDAEARMQEVEHLNEAEGPNFKIKDDPRVTKLGNFLRKSSIDELPQLLNVLRGEMSLVGPRPMSIRDVDLFDQGIQRKRFSVRPGLTCLWQVSGRSDLDFDDWLRLDLEYIETWSFWLDVKILFRTILVVATGRGAS